MTSKKGGAYNNLKAALITIAVEEMASVVEKCGGRRETVFGLSGLGDLYVTAMGGRNSMLGRLIGGGMSVEEALEEMRKRGVGVVEGYQNAATLAKYLSARDINRETAPLFYSVYSVLHEGLPSEGIIKALCKP